ncbi:LysR substrate-binding domain-containing protein [Microvirga pudoricolor]|uniref:LysR substrate-binding domain-containing protein n=1 Tax=Microvirga pudoricolor TaxID=2778729 RepID=UPI00194EA56B|nr:LysR substrate-binding domain-containing protein [Microvirga pudoricolor]MBM6592998.1 LysR family transcriptional regulator [Microvirga pudoricolor]
MVTRRLPPLNALRAFEAAARRRSISRAAEELGVTHGAVSHQVRTLEEFVGTDLLERAGNRFKLTVAGEQLLSPLSSGFDLLTAAVISLDQPSVRGDVTISAPPALTCLWLVKTVGSLLKQYPDLRLHLRPSNSPKEVIASDVDLCIRYGDGIWPGRRSERLADTELFPVCCAAFRTSRDLGQLADAPLLCAANGHEWDLWLGTVPQGGVLMGGRHYLGNHLAMIEAAVGGVGLAMGDSVTCRRYLEAGILVRPFAESVRAPDSFFLIDAGDHERRPAVTAVRRWILESFSRGAS